MDIENALEDCTLTNIPRIEALLDLGELVRLNTEEAKTGDMLWVILDNIRSELKTIEDVLTEAYMNA